MKRRFGGLLLLSMIFFLSLASFAFTENKKNPSKPEYVPGELLVRARFGPNEVTQFQMETLLSEVGVGVLRSYSIVPGLFHIKVRPGSEEGIIQRLNGRDDIAYAEPNYIYRTTLYKQGYYVDNAGDGLNIPNDEHFGKLWGLHNTGSTDSYTAVADADIDAPEAWEQGYTGSHDIVVAIIDTGSDYTHPDLVANAWINEGESGTYTDKDGKVVDKSTDKKDNDGNGFVDDVHGWDFVNDDNDPMDDNNHGTHVSGTIGAVGNNGIGVAGVVWNVRIMGVKFLSSAGSGSLADAVSAIEYANKMGAKVYNNSWGGGGFSQALLDAITATHTSGGLFVAAAGNSSNNNDANPSYPASYQVDNVLAVSATDDSDALTSWSSFGRRSVHVAAPGNNIYSTVPGARYDFMSGTSMATPHTVGLAVLVWSAFPELTNLELKERLIKSTEEKRSLTRKVASAGRINADYALRGFYPPKNGDFSPVPPWQVEANVIESDHNYKNSTKQSWTITKEGALFIRVHFEDLRTEAGYDFIKIKDADGNIVDTFDGAVGAIWSFEVPGDTAVITLEADGSISDWGFKIDTFAYK